MYKWEDQNSETMSQLSIYSYNSQKEQSSNTASSTSNTITWTEEGTESPPYRNLMDKYPTYFRSKQNADVYSSINSRQCQCSLSTAVRGI